MDNRLIDLTNQKFGKWFVLNKTNNTNQRYTYWDCICDCGERQKVASINLRKGLSLGCRKCSHVHIRKPYGYSAMVSLYNTYKANARNRYLNFELSILDFQKLTSQNCKYCNIKPTFKVKSKTGYGEYIYNGIDRKDNKEGYTLDNSVSCCKICNVAKASLTYDEFLNWIKAVYNTTIKGLT